MRRAFRRYAQLIGGSWVRALSTARDNRRAQRLQPLWRAYVGLAAPLAFIILAIGGFRLALMLADAARS
ncbi:MAG TPA: hypothetical protein VIK32_17995, partial [Candidatus Limnocylindrales bacterium]